VPAESAEDDLVVSIPVDPIEDPDAVAYEYDPKLDSKRILTLKMLFQYRRIRRYLVLSTFLVAVVTVCAIALAKNAHSSYTASSSLAFPNPTYAAIQVSSGRIISVTNYLRSPKH